VKVVDGATPAQRMTVDTDLNAHVEAHGNDPGGTDRVLRLSELGAVTPDGVYDAVNNTKPGNLGLIVATRNATPGDAQQGIRQTGIHNGTVDAADVAIFDSTGAPFSMTNPLPVTNIENTGSKVDDYKNATAIAAAATDNHDYTVTALKTLQLTQIEATASGKARILVQIETGVATGIFTTKFSQFNSTATPNMTIELQEHIAVAAGVRVRVAMMNRDNQAEDLNSTICGHEN